MRIAENVEMLEISGMGGTIYLTLTWDEKNLVLIDASFPGQIHKYDMELGLKSAGKTRKCPFNTVVAYHGGYLKWGADEP